MAVSSGVAALDAEGVPGVVHCRFLEQQQQHFELQWWRGKSSCLACCAFEMAAVDQILAWPERFIVASAVDLPAPLNDEVLGLIVFKAALEDPTAALASWNEDDSTPCSWAHVECDPATSRVSRLALDSLSLSGPLPRGLDRLPALAALSLSNNNLSGPIPPGLSLLPALPSLDLRRNAFSGGLPDDLARLPPIRALA
ncbi:hypothetical protein GW17_00049333, partial [Ensete ventricosum]